MLFRVIAAGLVVVGVSAVPVTVKDGKPVVNEASCTTEDPWGCKREMGSVCSGVIIINGVDTIYNYRFNYRNLY